MYIIYDRMWSTGPFAVGYITCVCMKCIGPWPKDWHEPNESMLMVPGTVDVLED